LSLAVAVAVSRLVVVVELVDTSAQSQASNLVGHLHH
jgi:hypothetical protein